MYQLKELLHAPRTAYIPAPFLRSEDPLDSPEPILEIHRGRHDPIILVHEISLFRSQCRCKLRSGIVRESELSEDLLTGGVELTGCYECGDDIDDGLDVGLDGDYGCFDLGEGVGMGAAVG